MNDMSRGHLMIEPNIENQFLKNIFNVPENSCSHNGNTRHCLRF